MNVKVSLKDLSWELALDNIGLIFKLNILHWILFTTLRIKCCSSALNMSFEEYAALKALMIVEQEAISQLLFLLQVKLLVISPREFKNI